MKKKILSLLVVMAMVFTTIIPGSFAATNAASDEVVINTTITDGMTVKGSKLAVEVIAIKDGVKIDSSLKLNDVEVTSTWHDFQKDTFTLNFKETGEYKVAISAGGKTENYVINYIKAEKGDYIGKAVFSLEGLTLGMGYIAPPMEIPVYEGDNAAIALDRVLTQLGLSYENTGSLEHGFYLSQVGDGGVLPNGCQEPGAMIKAPVNPSGSIPPQLKAKLDEKNAYINDSYADVNEAGYAKTMGEFEYTSMSGWMVTLNNSLTNVGFSDIYLGDGDVLRVQFTIYGFGADIGYGWGETWYTLADKTHMLKPVGRINSSMCKESWLADSKLKAAYDKASALGADLFADQADVNAATTELNTEFARVKADTLVKDLDDLTDVNWGDRAAVKEFRNIYNSLSPSEKEKITNIDKLIAAEKELAAFVEGKISEIPNHESEMREYLDAVKRFYNDLSDEAKVYVKNYSDVEKAEGTYVDTLITAIAAADDKEAACKTAREKYTNLPDASKPHVTKYADLQKAEAGLVDAKITAIAAADDKETACKTAREALENIPKGSEVYITKKADLQKAEAAVFDARIETIGSVDMSDKKLVDRLNSAYNYDMDKGTQKYVTKKNILDEASQIIDALYEDVVAVRKLCNSLPSASRTTYAFKARVEAAREAYDALPEPSKKEISSSQYRKITTCESRLAELQKEIDAVKAKINEIGTVTLDSKTKIDEARKAYDALPDESKTGVTNFATLEAAEQKIIDLNLEKEAAPVENLIAEIGTVEFTPESEAKIVAAEKAYSQLSEPAKAKVKNKDILDKARERYDGMVAYDKKTTEQAAAVDKLIEEIGTVTLDSHDAIAKAGQAYIALDNKAREKVTKHAELQNAKAEYDALVVDDLILKIGTVEFTPESEAKIVAAENAYKQLSEPAKAKVQKKDVLDKARARYNELDDLDKKEEADAKAVDEKIEAIGNVTIDSKEAIKDARKAYDDLSEGTKKRVTKLAVLEAAEEEIIVVSDITKKNVVLEAETVKYTGEAQTPAVTIEGLEEGKDFTVKYENNLNKGTAKVTVTATGEYNGTVTKEFTITAAKLAGKVTMNKNFIAVNGLYKVRTTGNNIAVNAGITVNGKALVAGKDFKVSRTTVKNPGSYKVTLTGMGNYEGTVTKTIVVTPKVVANAKVRLGAYNVDGYNDAYITWDKSFGADGYLIYSRRPGVTSEWSLMGTAKPTATSFLRKNLYSGYKYQFKVIPFVKYNDVNYRTTDGYRTLNLNTLKKVNTPKAVKSKGAAKVSWGKVDGRTGYQIAVTRKGKTSYFTTTNTYKSFTLKNVKTTYKVRAYKTVTKNGKSFKVYAPWSAAKTYTLR